MKGEISFVRCLFVHFVTLLVGMTTTGFGAIKGVLSKDKDPIYCGKNENATVFNRKLAGEKATNQKKRVTEDLALFYREYVARLEELILVSKKRESMIYIGADREEKQETLFALIDLGEKLEAIYTIVNKGSGERVLSRQEAQKQLTMKLKEINLASKSMLDAEANYTWYPQSLGPSLLRSFSGIWVFSALLRNVSRGTLLGFCPDQFYDVFLGNFFQKNGILPFYWLCLTILGSIAKQQGYTRTGMVNWVDSLLYAWFTSYDLCYGGMHFFYASCKLFLPFWVYYSTQYVTYSSFQNEVIPALEKYKKIAMSIGKYYGGSWLEPILEELGYPKVVALEIASFLDIGFIMEEIYPEEMNKVKEQYFDEVILDPTTLDMSTSRYVGLICWKVMAIVMSGVAVLLSIIYFGKSVLEGKIAT